jgi:Protein of unknown function (DUF3308).
MNKFMNKRLGFLLFSGSLTLNIFSQQLPSIQKNMPLDAVNNEHILFNRQAINPALSNDTIKFKVSRVHTSAVAGNETPRNLFSIAGKLPNSKSVIGLDFGYINSGIFKNQKLRLNYSYRLIINPISDLKAGMNLGFSRFKFDSYYNSFSGPSSSNVKWSYYPNLDIGLVYRRSNQNIGISYLEMINSSTKEGFTTYDITKRTLLVNYFSSYKLFKKTNILPEIIIFNDSHKTELRLKGTLSFNDKLLTGLIVDNSFKKYCFVVSGVFLKYFELGYILEYNNGGANNNYGMQSLKLGIILK